MKLFPNILGIYGAALVRPCRSLWCGLLCWLLVPAAHALEYELEGVARDEPRALDLHFQVWVRDCQWRIRCWHQNGQGLYFDTALLSSNELIRVMEFSTQRWATAVIESNRVPVGCEEPAASLLWLLLASGCSWSPTNSGLITPVYDPLASSVLDRDRRQQADWQLLPDSPHLPRQIVFWNDGRRRIWNSKTQKAVEIPIASAYGQRFTNAVALVTEVMEVPGLVLPRRFVFEQYSIGEGRKGAQLRVTRRFTGLVQSAKPVCTRTDLVPRPTFRTAVQDRRLLTQEEINSVTYSVNAGDWPDARQLRAIRRRQLQALEPPGLWQVLLFCGLALAPLAAVYWRRKSYPKTPQQLEVSSGRPENDCKLP